MPGKVIHGWAPHRISKDEDAVEIPYLSDLIDPDDPARPEIMKNLLYLSSFGVEFTEDIVRNVIAHSREHYARLGELDMRMRTKRELASDAIDGAEDSVVYYMRIGNRVKIGHTAKLADRVRTIGPEELMAIEPGGYGTEQIRHRQFAELRTHREWFRLEEPLTDFIEQLQGVPATI